MSTAGQTTCVPHTKTESQWALQMAELLLRTAGFWFPKADTFWTLSWRVHFLWDVQTEFFTSTLNAEYSVCTQSQFAYQKLILPTTYKNTN